MIGLSPSAISSFKDCPRCFWWEKIKKIRKPEGIKASLPNGMDKLMKAFVDRQVATGQPVPWLNTIPGAFPLKDRKRLVRLMNWQTNQTMVNVGAGVMVKVWGNVDDVIEHEDGRVTPWDFKTKGDEPGADYGEKYYQTQLDLYHLLLEGQGYTVTGSGVLSYGWPLAINADGTMNWGWKNLVMETKPERAKEILRAADACLRGPEPESSPGCGMCVYLSDRGGVTV